MATVQIRFLLLTENWRNALDNDLYTGTILMDLSKAFDCIPHNLLIPTLCAYGLGFGNLLHFFIAI